MGAYRSARPHPKTGKYPVVVVKRDSPDANMQVPCGMCTACRMDKAREWMIRCVHEAQLHEDTSFLTLTYSPEELPDDLGLHKKHHKDFVKRLRAKIYPTKIRYFMCGEYGKPTEKNHYIARPHYHFLLFGYDFPDKEFHKTSYSGDPLFISETLDKIWGKGDCYIGTLTAGSAGYVARYSLKKAIKKHADKIDENTGLKHYERIDSYGEPVPIQPEYIAVSNRPGLGEGWFQLYSDDLYPSDEVILDGRTYPVPAYYDQLMERKDPELFKLVKQKRLEYKQDNPTNPHRLMAKAHILSTRVKNLPRQMD